MFDQRACWCFFPCLLRADRAAARETAARKVEKEEAEAEEDEQGEGNGDQSAGTGKKTNGVGEGRGESDAGDGEETLGGAEVGGGINTPGEGAGRGWRCIASWTRKFSALHRDLSLVLL